MNAMINANDIIIPEIAILTLLAVGAAVWGYRHGLDTVLITAMFVVFGRVSSDILAVPVGIILNVLYGFFSLIASGNFSRDALTNTIFGGEGGPHLIDTSNPNDQIFVLISIAIFIAISYIGVKFAVKRAGGKDPIIEAVFGALGAAAMAYLTFGYIVNRVFVLPASIQITPTDVPQLTVNMPLILAIVMVLIVFGVQRSRPPAKKK
jgi:hypothetical protein